jgi:hypothetical protein
MILFLSFDWLHVEAPTWLTPYCSKQYDSISLLCEDEGIKQRQKRIKESWMNLLKNAGSQPLIHHEQMTNDGVMAYIRLQANQRTGKYLSGSSYNGKRSAIYHLVHVHWGKSGWSEEFPSTLNEL